MLLSVRNSAKYLSYLHICRVIIHDLAADGIDLSFFKKLNTCYRW